jgi:hypothetical protein
VRYRYSTNSLNQLLIRLPGETTLHPVNGAFRIDEDNTLEYRLHETTSLRDAYGLPSIIAFKGNWRLDLEHQPQLVCGDDVLTIRGKMIAADGSSLAYEVKSLNRQGLLHVQILKLSGIWLADGDNRLSFVVKKRSPDIVALQGAWQIDNNQQISYTYEREDLATKRKTSQTVLFQGFWQITRANKLTYILEGGTDSKFEFRGQIETPTIYPQRGAIKYRLGMGLRQDKRVTLYGTWKLSRALGLDFLMRYGAGKVRAIEFTAEISFARRNACVFRLKGDDGKFLGADIVFTHDFLKASDSRAFVRLKAQREAGIEAGVEVVF